MVAVTSLDWLTDPVKDEEGGLKQCSFCSAAFRTVRPAGDGDAQAGMLAALSLDALRVPKDTLVCESAP